MHEFGQFFGCFGYTGRMSCRKLAAEVDKVRKNAGKVDKLIGCNINVSLVGQINFSECFT